MIKDIDFGKVEDLAFAVVPENDGTLPEEEWSVFLVNMKNEPIEGVIVASTGYGDLDGKKVKTSTFRQFFDKVPSNELSLIHI